MQDEEQQGIELICDGESLIYRVGNLTSCHFYSDCVHGFLEFDSVLTALNGIYLNTDDFDVVFV